MKIICLMALLIFVVLLPFALAEDGPYHALISTQDGNYKTTVEVEDGKVVYVILPNGDNMTVYDAKIEDGEANGTDSAGNPVHIEIDNYDSFAPVTEDPDTETPGVEGQAPYIR